MIRSRTIQPDSLPMFLCRVSLVALPVIHRIFLIQTVHIIITIGFSQDGSSGNRQVFSVTLYHGCMRNTPIRIKTISINQQMLWTYRQLVYRPVHRQKRCIQNIDFIDFFRRNYTNRPCQSISFDNLTKPVSLTLSQLFRIVQQLISVIGRQNNSGCIYRPCKASTPRFITSGLYQIFM